MKHTADMLDYIHASPTPFHAVASTVERLERAGFTALDEAEPWSLAAGARHHVVRSGSSIAAFVVGTEELGEAGLAVVGAHTDSPNLRVKPAGTVARHGYLQAGVEIYGGVLLATWTDRDLGLAGRVVLDAGDGATETRLVRVDRPIARVPQLAIHLDRQVNDKGLLLNKEKHMPPVLALDADGETFESWLAAEVGIDAEAILSWDLMFHVLEPPAVGGIRDEFVYAPRLDNLASCHAGLEALLATCDTPVANTRAVVMYDNEEVGSATAQGASSSFLSDIVERIAVSCGGGPESLYRAKAKSLVVSADMAHAVHPNYAAKHEARHMPRLNGGPVIKVNANARYASDAETIAAFQSLCRQADVPCQEFVMRADMACGSTIGPLVATRLGIRTVDVGNPMLSMHSAREMAGAADQELMIRVLGRFYSD